MTIPAQVQLLNTSISFPTCVRIVGFTADITCECESTCVSSTSSILVKNGLSSQLAANTLI